jgi:hypothetical protein
MIDDINLIYETYHLPKIEKEGLTEVEYNHRCKYLKLYIRMIKKCQSMTEEELSEYYEIHHILPRCLNGKDLKENLVKMPIRYHIMAHIVLVEIYSDVIGLYHSLNLMFGINDSGVHPKHAFRVYVTKNQLSSKTVTRIREDLKRKMTGSNNHRAKAVISPEGKIYGSIKEASKDSNIPYMTLTKWLSGETSDHGWKYLDGKKTDFSNRDTKSFSKKVIGPDNQEYNSIIDACNKNNIPYTTLRYWLSGRVKNNHGWQFS